MKICQIILSIKLFGISCLFHLEPHAVATASRSKEESDSKLLQITDAFRNLDSYLHIVAIAQNSTRNVKKVVVHHEKDITTNDKHKGSLNYMTPTAVKATISSPPILSKHVNSNFVTHVKDIATHGKNTTPFPKHVAWKAKTTAKQNANSSKAPHQPKQKRNKQQSTSSTSALSAHVAGNADLHVKHGRTHGENPHPGTKHGAAWKKTIAKQNTNSSKAPHQPKHKRNKQHNSSSPSVSSAVTVGKVVHHVKHGRAHGKKPPLGTNHAAWKKTTAKQNANSSKAPHQPKQKRNKQHYSSSPSASSTNAVGKVVNHVKNGKMHGQNPTLANKHAAGTKTIVKQNANSSKAPHQPKKKRNKRHNTSSPSVSSFRGKNLKTKTIVKQYANSSKRPKRPKHKRIKQETTSLPSTLSTQAVGKVVHHVKHGRIHGKNPSPVTKHAAWKAKTPAKQNVNSLKAHHQPKQKRNKRRNTLPPSVSSNHAVGHVKANGKDTIPFTGNVPKVAVAKNNGPAEQQKPHMQPKQLENA